MRMPHPLWLVPTWGHTIMTGENLSASVARRMAVFRSASVIGFSSSTSSASWSSTSTSFSISSVRRFWASASDPAGTLAIRRFSLCVIQKERHKDGRERRRPTMLPKPGSAGHAPIASVKVGGFHRNQVDDAFEVALQADRHVDRRRIQAQFCSVHGQTKRHGHAARPRQSMGWPSVFQSCACTVPQLVDDLPRVGARPA